MKYNINRAIDFARDKHKRQVRKGTNLPYIFHPLEVAHLVAQSEGTCETMIIGAVLHDCLEDTDTTEKEIQAHFGNDVLDIVKDLSEADKSLSWKERKLETFEKIKDMSYGVKLIACADKLSNIRNIHMDLYVMGEKVWDKFNAGYEDQKWYYTGLVDALRPLEKSPVYTEFEQRVEGIFG